MYVLVVDFLQSYYSSVMVHCQQDMNGGFTQSAEGGGARSINMNLKILVLKYLRLSALHQGYPVKNSVEYAVVEDMTAQLKELLELRQTCPSLVKECFFSACATQLLLPVANNSNNNNNCDIECISSSVLCCCRFVFNDSVSGLDYNIVVRSSEGKFASGHDYAGSSSGPDQKQIYVPMILLVTLMVDNIYKILT
jgi:hypothetical protein